MYYRNYHLRLMQVYAQFSLAIRCTDSNIQYPKASGHNAYEYNKKFDILNTKNN